jgi:hypothetical protein
MNPFDLLGEEFADAITTSDNITSINIDRLLQTDFLFDVDGLGNEPASDDSLVIITENASEIPVSPSTSSTSNSSVRSVSPIPSNLTSPPPPDSLLNAVNPPKPTKSKQEVRKRGRAAAVQEDEEDPVDDQLGRTRSRNNEIRYRQGMQNLFDSLGKALGAPGLGRKKLLEVAVKRLSQPAGAAPAAPFPIDHRALFLTESTPLAILTLDGRYLDVNQAMERSCNHTLAEFVVRTVFSKITDPVLNAKYKAAFQTLLSNPTMGTEQAVPLICARTQQQYNANGYMLMMIFSVIMHISEPRPQFVRMRLSPVALQSEEYHRLTPQAFL